MFTQSRTNRLSALRATILTGLVTLPVVVAVAGDSEQTDMTASNGQQSSSAQATILYGRVTDKAGAALAGVRVRIAIPAVDMRIMDASIPHKQLEAKSDAHGDYRLEIPGITEPTKISIDAMKPGYSRLVGTLRSGRERRVDVVPGMAAEASLSLSPALYFSGVVVDEQARPIPAVKIASNVEFVESLGGIERIVSNSDGSFELFCYPVEPPARRNEVSKGVVSFFHPDYIDAKIEDIYALTPEQRESLRIVLKTGHKVTGTVFDVAGKPVPNAMIKAIRKDGTHRKATMTDANGRFALRGLSKGLTGLSARALDIKQKIHMPMAVNGDKNDLEVRLKRISLPTDLKTHAVLGMQLVDVTSELQSAYDLFADRGALILDPGKNADRLKIGQLAEGYVFFVVGNTRIGSVREFVNQILTETAGKVADAYSVRVVYSASTVKGDGSATQYLELTKDDLKQLQAVSDQLTVESR